LTYIYWSGKILPLPAELASVAANNFTKLAATGNLPCQWRQLLPAKLTAIGKKIS
jgi:hypothetical protein